MGQGERAKTGEGKAVRWGHPRRRDPGGHGTRERKHRTRKDEGIYNKGGGEGERVRARYREKGTGEGEGGGTRGDRGAGDQAPRARLRPVSRSAAGVSVGPWLSPPPTEGLVVGQHGSGSQKKRRRLERGFRGPPLWGRSGVYSPTQREPQEPPTGVPTPGNQWGICQRGGLSRGSSGSGALLGRRGGGRGS
jgi:hypothetical protein